VSKFKGQCEPGTEETFRALLTVVVCIKEFGIVYAEAANGHRFAITNKTPGVSVSQLLVGDKVDCLVTSRLPRVLNANLIEGK